LMNRDRELFNAVRDGNYNRVVELLEKGANVNARDDDYGGTPLHVASAWGRVDIAKLLIEKGADVNARNNGGLTPLHMAVYWNHPEVAKLLLENGADPSIRDNESRTPLDLARKLGYGKILRIIGGFGRPKISKKSSGFRTHVSGISIEPSNLYLGEWGRIIVKVRGSGGASLKLEGDVEWIDPGRVKLSRESAIEIPVKPKVSGEVPVKVTIESPGGECSRIVWLKVSERTRRCTSCGALAEPDAKYCWKCGAKLA